MIFRLLVVLMLLWSAPGAPAQEPPPPPATQQSEPAPPTPAAPDERFESPFDSMQTFRSEVRGIGGGYFDSERRALAIGTIATILDMDPSNEESVLEAAGQLTLILNKLGSMSRSQLPDQQEVEQEGLTAFTYLPLPAGRFPRLPGQPRLLRAFPDGVIELVRNERAEWTFSPATIAGLPAFSEAVRELPDTTLDATDISKISRSLQFEVLLRQYGMGQLVSNSFIGIRLWKWVALALIVFVGLVVDLLVRFILRRIWRRIERARGGEADRAALRRTLRPFGLFAAALVWLVGIRLFGLPDLALLTLTIAIRTILAITGIMAAYRVTDLVSEFFEGKAAGTTTKVDDLLVPLLRKTVKLVLTAMGLVYIADALTVPILPLLSGLGIGGLALGFAAKDSIENFFGSVAVIFDRPFEVGDWVLIGDVEGTVEELGFRSTRVRTFYNSIITVPNAVLVRANVDNFGKRRYRRVKTHLSITYDTPPDKIEAFCEGIRELIRLHPYTRKDYYQVWLHQFGASSLDILIYVFHEAPDWQTELRERQRLYLDILRLAHSMGVSFAFPTQTMYLRREEHEPADLAQAATAPAGIETAAIEAGREVARQVTGNASWREAKPPPYAFSTWGGADEGRGSAPDDTDD